MPQVTIDGMIIDAQKGQTILEVAQEQGIDIPTLCWFEGLSPYGGCRLCLVEEIRQRGSRLVTACTRPVEEGLSIKTKTARVIRARKMVLELLIARCPSSKTLQDMAAEMGLEQVRFRPKNETCILCGRCVRMCEEQMGGKAIGFFYRGTKRQVATPFHTHSEECIGCGGCMWVCPVCELRCTYTEAKDRALCGSCLSTMCAGTKSHFCEVCEIYPAE